MSNTNERAELIAGFRELAKIWTGAEAAVFQKAADMLEADAALADKRVAAIAADREYWREQAQQVAVPERTLQKRCNKGNLCPWSDEGVDGRSYCLCCGAKSQGSGQ